MTGAGIVGTAAAFANYQKAKKEYEALEEQYDGMMAAIATYESNKLNAYIESLEERPNDFPSGLMFSTLLRVGNMVGKIFRCQASLVVSNVSKQNYYIGSASVDCKVLDCQVLVYSSKLLSDGSKLLNQKTSYGQIIRPGETVEIFMPAGISTLVDKNGESIMGDFRKLICDAAGKQLITSCPKTSIEKAQTADILFTWREGATGELKTCSVLSRLGALRYCGEAYYPG